MKRKKDPMFALSVILLCTALAAVLGISRGGQKVDQKRPARQPNTLSGKVTFIKYCASCHGQEAKGKGPAAIALKAATCGSDDPRQALRRQVPVGICRGASEIWQEPRCARVRRHARVGIEF